MMLTMNSSSGSCASVSAYTLRKYASSCACFGRMRRSVWLMGIRRRVGPLAQPERHVRFGRRVPHGVAQLVLTNAEPLEQISRDSQFVVRGARCLRSVGFYVRR